MRNRLLEGAALPWRSDAAAPRPVAIALPAAGEATWIDTTMPLLRGARPLKRWRYVGVYAPELMLCIGDVSIGPARQTFWAVWDRDTRRLLERTRLHGHSAVTLEPGRAQVRDGDVEIELWVEENAGIESVCRHGASGYTWTRKQGGVAARGRVSLPGSPPRSLQARAVIDDSAGYHARATSWLWSAGVGVSREGAAVAWNLVSGLNDPPAGSERSVWIDGVAREVSPVRFLDELTGVCFAGGEEMAFSAEAVRARRDNMLLVRSDYEQPFGTFSGTLDGGVQLAEGYGVMERHSARW
jgi:hypothetical protein